MEALWNKIIQHIEKNKDLNEFREISIGQMSKLTGVSVRSIRHYCEIGLIKPIRIDDTNGYRYFELDHIIKLHLIKSLRSLSVSLPEIKEMIHQNSLDETLKIIDEKLQDIDNEMEHLLYKKNKLNALRGQLSQVSIDHQVENIHISVKTFDTRYYLKISNDNKRVDGLAYKEAFDFLDQKAISYDLRSMETYFAIFQDQDFSDTNSKMQYASMVENSLAGKTEVIPAGDFITMVYIGEYDALFQYGYPALRQWIKQYKYEVEEVWYEIYHISRPFNLISNQIVTEVQMKIKTSLTLP